LISNAEKEKQAALVSNQKSEFRPAIAKLDLSQHAKAIVRKST